MSGKEKSYEMDMCSGAILPKLLRFAIPLMCSSLLQLLFNAADVIVVGRFAGDNALAAVGSNTSIITLMTNIFMGLSVGVNVLVAHYYAAKQQKNVEETVQTAMTVAIISGIIVNIVGFVSARQILVWMASPAEVIDLATTYLRVYFFGMVAMMCYNFGASILRAVGDTRRAMYYLAFAGVVNVILNLIFVIGLHLSVVGVGLATVISQFISGGLIIRCLCREKGAAHLDLRHLYIKKDKFLNILKIGIPAGLQSMIFCFSNLTIQASINSFGAVTVAGNSAASSIEGFVYVGMNSFSQAAISFTSQNLGAGKIDRIKKIILQAQACVFVVGAGMGWLFAFFGSTLLGFYTTSADVMAVGMIRLSIVCMSYFLCGMMDVMTGCLRGLGYSLMPTITTVIGVCGIRMVWVFTGFRMEQFHSINTLYMTYPVSWLLTLIIHILCLSINWKKRFGSKQERLSDPNKVL